ncbi:MAG: hypothetical protein BWY94_00547 [Actinobacteria bacterium ADurb.BinA094]|nr:MAG: hypothetical protein BWY94_00547 [Actinobacteria bacterium ADurb.BinA094]
MLATTIAINACIQPDHSSWSRKKTGPPASWNTGCPRSPTTATRRRVRSARDPAVSPNVMRRRVATGGSDAGSQERPRPRRISRLPPLRSMMKKASVTQKAIITPTLNAAPTPSRMPEMRPSAAVHSSSSSLTVRTMGTTMSRRSFSSRLYIGYRPGPMR